jgi:hypothetical protein
MGAADADLIGDEVPRYRIRPEIPCSLNTEQGNKTKSKKKRG